MGPQAITALMDGLITIAGLVCLVWYGVNRKWAEDQVEKIKNRPILVGLVRYRVELIIAAVLVPQWADWLPQFFGGK